MTSFQKFFLSAWFFALAANSFAQSSATDPKFLSAIELFNSKKYDESKTALQEMTSANPGVALYWFNLGNAEFMLGDHDQAIDAYDRVIELKSPLAPAAWFYIAKSHLKKGKTTKAADVIIGMRDDPIPDGLHASINNFAEQLQQDLLKSGNSDYQAENFETAKNELRLALEVAPASSSADDVLMLLGMSQLKTGAAGDAKKTFKQLIEQTSDASLKDSAQFFLEQAKEDQEIKYNDLWLYIEAAGGVNSNVFAVGSSSGPIAKGTAQAQLGFGYVFSRTKRTTSSLGYSGFGEEFFGLPALRFFSHTLQEKTAFNPGRWSFQILPTFRYQVLATDPFMQKFGGTFRIERKLGQHAISVSYAFERIIPIRDDVNYLIGYSHVRKLAWNYDGESVTFDLSVSHALNQTGDIENSLGRLPLANTSYGPSASMGWRFDPTWELDLHASYLIIDYKNPALPENTDRDDKQFNASVRLTKHLGSGFKAFVSPELTVNNSTLGTNSLDNKNYSQVISLVGVGWDL